MAKRSAQKPSRDQWEKLYAHLQDYGRVYTFRDPNGASYHDLRVNECYVLDYLVEYGDRSVSDLAANLGIHKSSASRITSSLQDKGLLEAVSDPDDKRSFVLSPTKSGVARRADVRKQFVGMLGSILSEFDKSEINTAMRVVAALSRAAEERITNNSA